MENGFRFPDVTKHPDYLKPQSLAWCEQLARQTGRYAFPWKGVPEGTTAEERLAEKLEELLPAGGTARVLDVGCGHGEFTNRWADRAGEVVGYDMTEGFLRTAEAISKPHVRYVLGRTQDGLPFENDTFDFAYTKKGPTSWYAEGNRIVKPGGRLVLLHPGDGNGKGGELGLAFPGLFAPPMPGTPVLDRIRERLDTSGLSDIRLTVLQETVWLPSPEDVLAMVTFGQSERFADWVRDTCGPDIATRFELHASGSRGIRTTGFYYLIEAVSSA